jgi:hypothetical protein
VRAAEVLKAALGSQTRTNAALRALREAGFVIVPVEPTPEMVEAGWMRTDAGVETDECIPRVWRAMINEAGK